MPGTMPKDRNIDEYIRNGIIILDKPSGPSSHQVDGWIKDILGVEKCSHGGTLDPRTSGVMVIALLNSTKLMPIFLKSDKEYVALMNVHDNVPEKKIRQACLSFVGKITQLPPVKSAVKRAERQRRIYEIEVLEINGRDVLFRVKCQHGTYIRRLCDDIGKKLGCGANMIELRRITSGNFDESRLVTLQDLIDAAAELKNGDEKLIRKVILPMEETGVKRVVIKDNAVDAICNGAPLGTGGVEKSDDIQEGELVGIFTQKGEFVAIGEARLSFEELKNKKRMAVKTDRVLMKKGTYPKTWGKYK